MSTSDRLKAASVLLPSRLSILPSFAGPLLGLAIVFLLFVALIGLRGVEDDLKRFLSFSNLQVMVKDRIVYGVLALGMLLVIISGGIDLSVGSVVALVTVVTMYVYRFGHARTESQDLASALAIPAGVAVGVLCGLGNGLLITRLRVMPFIATLGMLSIARGLAFWLSGRRTLEFPRDARPAWVDALSEVHATVPLGPWRVPSFNPGFWTVAVLAVAAAVLLHRTVLGRHCYAIGSNELGARLCGVPIVRTKVWVYTLAGLLAGWGGVLLFAQIGSGEPGAAVGLELEVIAAVVIGGASLTGGRGTVTGTLLGVLILGVLRNGVQSFDVPVEVQYILIGIIIVANTALSQWQRPRQ